MTIKETEAPKFGTIEEEKRYWEDHGPLAKGKRGRVNKSRAGQKRSSFLVIRLTGEELTRLRDIAATQGMGPSTFARLVVMREIEPKSNELKVVSLGHSLSSMASGFSQTDKAKFETFLKDVAIGEQDNPALLVFSGERKTWDEVTSLFLRRLLKLLGVHVVISGKEDYDKLKETVRSQT
ncbi:MAG: hypothetical protein HY670_04065 [Chloroflexi bacterium]|nr:hypothetical protein [Chloroflexota bacterium]